MTNRALGLPLRSPEDPDPPEDVVPPSPVSEFFKVMTLADPTYEEGPCTEVR